jgi:hypothetical protein
MITLLPGFDYFVQRRFAVNSDNLIGSERRPLMPKRQTIQ